MEESAVKGSVSVEDGVVIVSARVDVIELLEALAKQSDNTVDDVLVSLVRMAKANLDWKGHAIEHFKKEET